MRTALDLWVDVDKTGVEVRATDGRSVHLIELTRVAVGSPASGEQLVAELVEAMTAAARAVLESAGGATA